MGKKQLEKYRGLILPLVLLILLAILVRDSFHQKVIYTSEQPDTINYNSYDPYLLEIYEGSTKWNTLFWPRQKELRIVRAGGDYGHYITLDITGADYDSIRTIWSSTGVHLEFNTGHELFIPKSSFVGGR